MLKWVNRIWVGVAIVLPAMFGLMLLTVPGQMPTLKPTIDTVAGIAGTSDMVGMLYSLAGMSGARDIVFSGVLIAALLLLEPKAMGILIAGRGVIDLTDGLQSLAKGQAAAAMPLVFGMISFAVAYLILRDPAGAGLTRTPAVPQRKGR